MGKNQCVNFFFALLEPVIQKYDKKGDKVKEATLYNM